MIKEQETKTRKYFILSNMYTISSIYGREFSKNFKLRLCALLGVSTAKFSRYLYAELDSVKKVETISVAHMTTILEQLNIVLPEEGKLKLEDMYHPDIVGESLKIYRSPIITHFAPSS